MDNWFWVGSALLLAAAFVNVDLELNRLKRQLGRKHHADRVSVLVVPFFFGFVYCVGTLGIYLWHLI